MKSLSGAAILASFPLTMSHGATHLVRRSVWSNCGAMERLLDYTVVLGAVRHSLVQLLHGHVLVKIKSVCVQSDTACT